MKKEKLPTSKTRYQLASEMGISYDTLRRRIKEAGLEVPSGLLSPVTIRRIYVTLGFPLPEAYKRFDER